MSIDLTVTAKDAENFVAEYNKARKEQKLDFYFEGNCFVIEYAYYMIQFFQMKGLLIGSFDREKLFTLKS